MTSGIKQNWQVKYNITDNWNTTELTSEINRTVKWNTTELTSEIQQNWQVKYTKLSSGIQQNWQVKYNITDKWNKTELTSGIQQNWQVKYNITDKWNKTELTSEIQQNWHVKYNITDKWNKREPTCWSMLSCRISNHDFETGLMPSLNPSFCLHNISLGIKRLSRNAERRRNFVRTLPKRDPFWGSLNSGFSARKALLK